MICMLGGWCKLHPNQYQAQSHPSLPINPPVHPVSSPRRGWWWACWGTDMGWDNSHLEPQQGVRSAFTGDTEALVRGTKSLKQANCKADTCLESGTKEQGDAIWKHYFPTAQHSNKSLLYWKKIVHVFCHTGLPSVFNRRASSGSSANGGRKWTVKLTKTTGLQNVYKGLPIKTKTDFQNSRGWW